MKRISIAATTLLALVISARAALGADAAPKDAPPNALPAKESASVTHHSLHAGGMIIPYTATAGTITLRNSKNEPTADMFYVAYTQDGIADLSHRPVTFFYNGGPGSATIWLHMGSLGPKRVITSDAAATPPAPFGLADNEYSLLDKSDLVFIDAVGTGFSRIVEKGKPKDFYGVDSDARAFGQFIQRYVTINNRWNSPKFLFGESYGTTRSAVLVNYLQGHGMGFNGVTLLSSYLNAGLYEGGDGNDYVYMLYLPTEAAIAWYHNKVPNKPADLAAFVQSARQFALGDYANALLRGSALPATERTRIVHRLHAFIGLPESTIRDADLRVDPSQFEKMLLHDRYRVVGRLDGRFAGIDTNPSDPTGPSFDPSESGITAAFVGAFNNYVRNDLGFASDLTYKDFGDEIGDWDFKHATGGAPQDVIDVLPDLRQAMSENPHLRVLSANGYFDMATPFYETQYVLSHMGLDRALQNHITYTFYESGHMVYLHVPVLKQLHEDLVRFYDATLHVASGDLHVASGSLHVASGNLHVASGVHPGRYASSRR